MNPQLQKVLIKITECFNSAGITWGVGASVLLHQYSLVESPSDIDIITTIPDIQTADELLSFLGEKQPASPSSIYKTDYFYEYVIEGINVDLIAGLKIVVQNGIFKYDFNKYSVPHTFTIKGTTIPFMTLEEWYILYQLMPGKAEKVSLIKSYLTSNAPKYPFLLKNLWDESKEFNTQAI